MCNVCAILASQPACLPACLPTCCINNSTPTPRPHPLTQPTPFHPAPTNQPNPQRASLRKNLSLIELSGSKRGEVGGEEGMPEPTQSPTATAVSWQQYVVRITEDEEEGVFF